MALSKDQIKAELEAVQEEIARVEAEAQRRVKKLEQRAEVFAEMLSEATPKQSELPLPGVNLDTSTLRSFLQQALADGKPRDLPELVKMVEGRGGLLRGDAIPGRAVHGALQAMRQIGLTKREEGKWAVVRP